MASMNIARYRKFLVALAGAVVAIGLQLAADGTLGDWGPPVTSLLTALGVYLARNARGPGDGDPPA